MSKVENVARALYHSWANYPACADTRPWEGEAERMPGKAEHFRKHARAAIEAMREPTMKMVMAAHKHHEGEAWLPNSLFNSMIDAALSEQQP